MYFLAVNAPDTLSPQSSTPSSASQAGSGDSVCSRRVRVSVAGASGYAGGELIRLLIAHPGVELAHLAAGQQAGRRLDQVFPSLGHSLRTQGEGESLADRRLVETDWERLGAESEVVFLALPHGLSLLAAPALLEAGARVVDLGGDFRLQDTALFQRWYGIEHSAPELLREAVYGLPELFREQIANCRLVANPGCYPTAAILALLPLVEAGAVDPSAVLIVDAKSGVSGAGRQAAMAFGYAEVNENLRAYKALDHRHQPEIEQGLAWARRAGDRHGSNTEDSSNSDPGPSVAFVPHLVPMTRGILASCYAPLASAINHDDVQALYTSRYQDEPFVRVLTGDALPATKNVGGSNFCEIAIVRDKERDLAVAFAAIDNLGRGAASSAVVNFNLMCGFDEATGVRQVPLFP